MTEPVWLTQKLAMIAHDQSLSQHGGAPGLRDQGLLDSALARPQNLAAYGEPDIFELAAAYSAGLVSNHPFIDGNKRTGFLLAFVFLDSNGFELSATEADATLMMIDLAVGRVDEEGFARWLRDHCVAVGAR